MKTLVLALSLAAAGVSTAGAQVYQPAITNGTILGGIAGALIGGHNHDRWGEGALIGAVAGTLLGAAVEQPRSVVYAQPPVTVIQAAPTVPNAQIVAAAPGVGTQQMVVQQQPVQIAYVPYYAPAPVVYYDYPAPVVRVGVGYTWGPRRNVYVRSGFRHW